MTAQTNKPTLLLLLTTAALLLGQTQTHAQTRIDPRHPSVAYMQEWGTMDGTTLQCLPGWKEEALGKSIIPTGDLNNDGLADYILERERCDTAFGAGKTTRGNELLLFYGKKNKLPTPAESIRIGPTEIGSISTFLCTGDFDADGFFDIACRYDIIDDTSYGNTEGLYTLSQVIIFWNDRAGHFSLNDTSWLACDGPVWLGGRQAIAADFTNDGITDLLVQTSAKQWNYGTFLPAPRLYLFTGQVGKRWGRSGESRSPVFRWWNPPAFKYMQYRDHDCSGENDLIFFDGDGNIFGNNIIDVHVAYQRSETPWIDTTEIETINVRSSGSEFALFSDVTGDHVLDLVTIGGDFEGERISVFAGKPGQRLLEQYGTGTDSADRANGRFPLRPWVKMPTPTVLHDGWTGSEHVLFDLGDINGDDRSEIVAHSKPFIIIYTTGRTLDSLIDVMAQVPGDFWDTMTRLGDIDGSGMLSFAVRYNEKVHFLKAPPKDEIPTYGGRLRSLPHAMDFHCQLSSGVEAPSTINTQEPLLNLSSQQPVPTMTSHGEAQ